MKWVRQTARTYIGLAWGRRVEPGAFIAHVEPLAIVCVVEEVAGEWWCYCYKNAEDIAPPSTHKTSAAAKKRARKNVLAWIDARRVEVLK